MTVPSGASELDATARRVIEGNRYRATSCEVDVPGRHPLDTVGIDVRMPADPTRAA